eukprot:TRINITY_DN1924_c0_g1_i1.p1 TRINITY_DN1924_c0_g1~~TRINITY_DN1924_c0_g1_i1.p1  ORF type:complete len:306 (-),score=69.32 TRINITY_DN1924_c0_g1_i1:101-970(-)
MCIRDRYYTLGKEASRSSDFSGIRDFSRILQSLWSNNLVKKNPSNAVFFLNYYLKCLFSLKNYSLANKQESGIKSLDLVNNADTFPASQRVTFFYFYGRLRLLNDDYSAAQVYLSRAFYSCKRDDYSHKRNILIYLIPSLLLLGKFPTNFNRTCNTILKEYNLMEYAKFIESVKKGDLRTFNQAFEANKMILIKRGLYFIMDKIRTILIRNLLFRIYLFHFTTKNDHKVDIALFQKGINLGLDEEHQYDLEEVESIIASFIFDNKMKAYISHKHLKVVFSNREPFPKIA